MIYTASQIVRSFEVYTIGYRAVFNVEGFTAGAIQVVQTAGAAALSTGVIKFQRSNDGLVFEDFVTPVSMSAVGFSDSLTLNRVKYVAAVVTTTQTGIIVELSFIGKGPDPVSTDPSVSS